MVASRDSGHRRARGALCFDLLGFYFVCFEPGWRRADQHGAYFIANSQVRQRLVSGSSATLTP
ncbi:hypothetical protein FRAHR75_570045 [Frankia sp. Hr75.2]|nr:hypothetical protein FRAHR75_570045 [Frankia sp. Hr75.2]